MGADLGHRGKKEMRSGRVEQGATMCCRWLDRHGLKLLGAIGVYCLALVGGSGLRAEPELPNIVLIMADDQGYADIGVYGAKGFETPHLDRLAGEGMRFTDFYVTQPVCGASRAGLLTGCYPNRIGLPGAPDHRARHGIHEAETTLAELLKGRGYATAIFGKWHLGHHRAFLPLQNGFDEYFGLPYSNDMWPYHPEARPGTYPPLPLMEGNRVIGLNPDPAHLTTWYTERAVSFIERNRERPFFLYLPHSMPHVPLGVSKKFKGKSAQGLYGDVIMELDWSVGQVLEALERQGLTERTLVIYTSDNGPWLSYGTHAGNTGILREGKGTTWDGGVRVPCIMRWPGRIPAGTVTSEPVMTIDILPTVAGIVGAQLPALPIDGEDILPLMLATPGVRSPHEALFFYYGGNELQSMRSGRWKLVFPHRYRTLAGRPGGTGGIPAKYEMHQTGLALYDLTRSPDEARDVLTEYPAEVQRLQKLADRMRAELGDDLTGVAGAGRREPGRVADESAN